MARLWNSGFELDSTTANLEWTQVGTGQTIGTTHARSGTYAGRISGMTSATRAGFQYQFTTSASGPFWLRTYLYIVTLPSAENRIISWDSATTTIASGTKSYITLDNTGVLRLYNGSGTLIGTSSALSTGSHYCIETKRDGSPATGHRVSEARLNGVVFATSSSNSDTTQIAFTVGGNLNVEAQTVGEWWFDDIAVNDSTGSSQNSYPGPGRIVYLRPAAVGDSDSWTKGGSTPAATTWQSVNETPPDDAVTLVSASALNTSSLYKMTASGIGSDDAVNVIQVFGRYSNDTADSVASFKYQIEKAASGTISQSAAIIPNSTTWRSANSAPRNSNLTLYLDPDGSLPWTKADLDTMQVGGIITAANLHSVRFTALWVTVDYAQQITGSATETSSGVATQTLSGLTDATATQTTSGVATETLSGKTDATATVTTAATATLTLARKTDAAATQTTSGVATEARTAYPDATGLSTSSGTATQTRTAYLDATGLVTTSATADETLSTSSFPLDATATVTTLVTADLDAADHLDADETVTTSGTATATRSAPLDASGTATTSATSSDTLAGKTDASAVQGTTGTASVTRTAPLDATSIVTTSATATASTPPRLADAAQTVTTSATAAQQRTAYAAADSTVTSSATASLAINRPLDAVTTVTTSAIDTLALLALADAAARVVISAAADIRDNFVHPTNSGTVSPTSDGTVDPTSGTVSPTNSGTIDPRALGVVTPQ